MRRYWTFPVFPSSPSWMRLCQLQQNKILGPQKGSKCIFPMSSIQFNDSTFHITNTMYHSISTSSVYRYFIPVVIWYLAYTIQMYIMCEYSVSGDGLLEWQGHVADCRQSGYPPLTTWFGLFPLYSHQPQPDMIAGVQAVIHSPHHRATGSHCLP